MLRICTWLWKQNGYRKQFTAEHVNTLRRMVRRNLTLPHEFVCITDMPEGLDAGIRTLPLQQVPAVQWDEHRPNCFKRLWLFSDAARFLVGSRIINMDLDCVITGNLDAPFSRPEDFVIWRDVQHGRVRGSVYNGSLWMLTAGSRRQVWEQFRGEASRETFRKNRGSDQAWISAVLPNEATFGPEDGVYSYRWEARRKLPKNAAIVLFHGKPDPWEAMHLEWVREHYR